MTDERIEELVKKYETSGAYCGTHAVRTRAESHINLRAALREFGAECEARGREQALQGVREAIWPKE